MKSLDRSLGGYIVPTLLRLPKVKLNLGNFKVRFAIGVCVSLQIRVEGFVKVSLSLGCRAFIRILIIKASGLIEFDDTM